MDTLTIEVSLVQVRLVNVEVNVLGKQSGRGANNTVVAWSGDLHAEIEVDVSDHIQIKDSFIKLTYQVRRCKLNR
jgi:hypothetical protein